jgi:predicted HTH domain antitoxin
MYISIELPDDYFVLNKKDTVIKEIKLSYALWLFQQSRITINKASQLSGLSLQNFILAYKEYEVPITNISKQKI